MIKIFRGGKGWWIGRGGSSEGCLKGGGGGSLRDLSKKHLKTVSKGKSWRGFEGVTTPALPPPPENFNHTLATCLSIIVICI